MVPGRDLKVLDMCASISGGLRKRERRTLPPGLQRVMERQFEPLGRIADSSGNHKKNLTAKQHQNKRSVGSSKQRPCYVCRKYKQEYTWATGVCQRCGTCLCLPKKYAGRSLTCQEEHMSSPDPAIRCNGVKKGSFPASSRAAGYILKGKTRHGDF